jgi:pyruvyl transferase EpsO
MHHIEVVKNLRDTLIDSFRSLIPRDQPVALIDYPDTANSGDHAIWLGEKALLRLLGVDPAYQCSLKSYDRSAMAAALKNGTILMHGGGNFGDIYVYQRFRQSVIQQFPNNNIIVFPQTVMFFSDEQLLQSARLFGKHGRITVAGRDALSVHVLQKFFAPHCNIVHTPDAAFAIGPVRRSAAPRCDFVWLSRTDSEGIYGSSIAKTVDLPDLRRSRMKFAPVDGIESSFEHESAGSKLMVTDWYRCRIDAQSVEAYKNQSMDQRSRFWLNRALMLLSAGRVVITDRLHAHILCTLVGIPHVLLDNFYGKNFAFYRTWCRPLGICRLARSPEDAWSLAQQLLEEWPDESGVAAPGVRGEADHRDRVH